MGARKSAVASLRPIRDRGELLARLRQEEAELAARCTALDAFDLAQLEAVDAHLLERQLDAMLAYRGALIARIARLAPAEPHPLPTAA